MACLILMSGLPGVGKSTVARRLAGELGAAWLRIDSIERALLAAGFPPGELSYQGYRVAHAVAEDNLKLGLDVIADAVNPWTSVREDWRAVALLAGARFLPVELRCTDQALHRARAQSRAQEGFALPTWQEIQSRDYRPWESACLSLDTAALSVSDAVAQIMDALRR